MIAKSPAKSQTQQNQSQVMGKSHQVGMCAKQPSPWRPSGAGRVLSCQRVSQVIETKSRIKSGDV
jgi:hypothetical protein